MPPLVRIYKLLQTTITRVINISTNEHISPPDRIHTFRSLAQDMLLNICDSLLKRYTDDSYTSRICDNTSGGSRETCDAIHTGLILRQFGRIGLLPDPLKSEQARLMSVQELADKLCELPRVAVLVDRTEPCRPQRSSHLGTENNRRSVFCRAHDGHGGSNCPPCDHQTTCGFQGEIAVSVNEVLENVQGLAL